MSMSAAAGGGSDGSLAVRLAPCPQGGYCLTVGGATVCLSEAELALLGRAIHVMAGRRPSLLEKLIAETIGDGIEGEFGEGEGRTA
jgi:hypothetical protein